MHVIGSFSHNCNKIWIHIFVEHRAIGEDATLRVHLFDGIFGRHAGDFLCIVGAAELQSPNWRRSGSLEIVENL